MLDVHGFLPEGLLHERGQGSGQVILILPAQAGGQVPLGVGVYQKDTFPLTGQAHSQIDSGGSFAGATLLVGQGDDPAVGLIHGIPPFCLPSPFSDGYVTA